MRKKVLLLLSALALVAVIGGVAYATSSRVKAPVIASEVRTITVQGAQLEVRTITVQGTHLEGGGCAYSFSTLVPGGSMTVQETPQSGSNSGSSSAAPGESHSGSVRKISQDDSNCTAVYEVSTRTSSVSDTASAGDSPNPGNIVTVQGTPNKSGGCDYSGTGNPARKISEDSSNCTAVMEFPAPGRDPEHEGGSWASSSATPTAAP